MEVTCPSGKKVVLREPSSSLVRLIQPNILLQEVEGAKEAPQKSIDLVKKLEKIFALIVKEPRIYVPDGLDDEIPEGHVPSYEFTDEDIGYVVGFWTAPFREKVEKLKEDAAPLSETPKGA